MKFLSLNKLLESSELLEKTRQELLHKQKKETPERVQRANAYSVSNINIDSDAFMHDWLVITTTISGNSHSYTDSIAFKGVFTDLIEVAKQDSLHTVNSKLIIKSIHASLDKNDIYIDCNCPDFKYRYAFWSTQDKFKWGKLQNSNGKEIRNPKNNMGCMCKHLYALLRSNNFLNAISDKIMRIIMANLDILYKRYNFNIEEFKVNTKAYDKLLTAKIGRDKYGRFTKVSSNNKDNKEELQNVNNNKTNSDDRNKGNDEG